MSMTPKLARWPTPWRIAFSTIGCRALCGTAYAERRRVVVEDTEVDSIYAPHRAAARKAGVRACHSTPLISRRGDTIVGRPEDGRQRQRRGLAPAP